ncbi:hypothetical protein ACQPYK_33975 [Streptosporangium sp. CA-135522]|uniref:hypothetical protein n=1 Tax=Streptosporangium sp. CA-135522 TaxID=3240072 RepID=UPI003D8A07BA
MLATATAATAETGLSASGFVVAPPYPPHPINNNNNNNGADPFDPSDPDDFDCGDECCDDGCGPIAEEVTEELPFTGAPVATVAALGGGLLAAGAATLISVRRRRSSSGA